MDASEHVDGANRILELPHGKRNRSLWRTVVPTVFMSVVGLGGLAMDSSERFFAFLLGGAALVLLIISVRGLLTRTRIVFTPDTVTVIQESPFHAQRWAAARKEFRVDAIGSFEYDDFLDLYVGEVRVRVMQGFPREQIALMRAAIFRGKAMPGARSRREPA